MMESKIPKDTKQIEWTNHAIGKMRQYGLSEQKVRSVLYRHTRKEEGIAPRTIAVMQPTGSAKRPSEIWVMYQVVKAQKAKRKAQSGAGARSADWSAVLPASPKKRIITTWRYPGVSPKRNPIPPEIADELLALAEDSRNA